MNDQEKLLNISHKSTPQKIFKCNDLIDPIRLTGFYNKLEYCLCSTGYKNNATMGPIVICLNSDISGTDQNMLDHTILGEYLESGKSRVSNVLIVDYDGRLIEIPEQVVIENPADAAEFYNEDNLTLFFVSGARLDIFYKTKVVTCIPNIFTRNRSVIVSNMTLPISDYQTLIDAHYKKRIDRKRFLGYWKDKNKRYLVAAPEKIFGNDLASYLDDFVSDGHVDSECYNAWTNDRTDIRIIRYEDRHIYIIEVKWLGKSESDKGNITIYDDTKANSGIAQLNVYLKEEVLSVCGILVLYDARDQDVEIKYDSKIKRDARIKPPMRFYLISESASAEGDRIAKKSKPR